MIKRLAILGAVLALSAAACGGSDATPTTVAAATSTTAAPITTTTTSTPATTAAPIAAEPSLAVAVADTALGEILVDGDGNTLYLFTPDESGPSVCNGDCAAAWPPVLGEVAAGTGTDAALLGSAARDDGATQATYNSWPLYYFARDATPGDTNGQGLNDVWYVITPTGEAIGASAALSVAVADSALGEIVVDGDGNTLYLFTPDESGPSVCNDDCAAAWPPVIGEVEAGTGIDAALLGSAPRDDGAAQATYNSWPLYYFARDGAPGDTNGQGLNDVWYVLTPTGEAIR